MNDERGLGGEPAGGEARDEARQAGEVEQPEQHVRTATGLESLLQQRGGRPWVSFVLAGLNVAVFAAMVMAGVSASDPDADDLLAWGADFGPLTVGGQWWRLLTCMFVHIGALHLAVNMWYLLRRGTLFEKVFGARAYLCIYVFSGLCGSLASASFHPNVVGAGASGALFGVTGAFLGFLHRHKRLAPNAMAELGRGTWVFVGYNLAYGFAPGSNIDNAAHVGGLLGGLAAAWLLGRATEIGSAPARIPSSSLAAMGVVVLVGSILAHGLVGRSAFGAATDRWTRAEEAWEEQDWKTVVDEVTAALESDTDPVLFQMRGAALYHQGELQRALADLDRALKDEPGDAWARYYHGLVSWQLGDFVKARSDLERANLSKDAEPEWRVELCALEGDAALAKKQWQVALAKFEQVPIDSQLNAYAIVRSAWALAGLHKHSEALVRIERFLESHPDDGRALQGRARLRRDTRDYDGALADLERCVALSPDDASAQRELAGLRLLRGELAAARRAAQRAVERESRSGWSRLVRGYVAVEAGLLAEAEADFRHALELQDAVEAAWIELGHLRHMQLDFERARECYERALRAEPDSSRAETGMGMLEHDRGDWAASSRRLERALELDDEEEDTLQLYLWMNRTRAEEDDADERLARYLEQRRERADAPLRADWFPEVARCLLEPGELEPGFDGLSWPSERFERWARSMASYSLGMRRLAEGNEQAARAAFEHCLGFEQPWSWTHASSRARLAELK